MKDDQILRSSFSPRNTRSRFLNFFSPGRRRAEEGAQVEGSQPDGNPVAVKPLEFTFLNQENSNLCVLASLIHALQFAIPVSSHLWHRTCYLLGAWLEHFKREPQLRDTFKDEFLAKLNEIIFSKKREMSLSYSKSNALKLVHEKKKTEVRNFESELVAKVFDIPDANIFDNLDKASEQGNLKQYWRNDRFLLYDHRNKKYKMNSLMHHVSREEERVRGIVSGDDDERGPSGNHGRQLLATFVQFTPEMGNTYLHMVVLRGDTVYDSHEQGEMTFARWSTGKQNLDLTAIMLLFSPYVTPWR